MADPTVPGLALKRKRSVWGRVKIYFGFSSKKSSAVTAGPAASPKSPLSQTSGYGGGGFQGARSPRASVGKAVYSDDFGDEFDQDAMRAMIATEVAAATKKTALKPKLPQKPQPPQYAADKLLAPLQTRQKIYAWMEPPDIQPAVGVRAADPQRKFVASTHGSAGHEKLHHVPLAERTYARYPPGTGPFFGGPTFPLEVPGGSVEGSNTAQFVVIVTALSFAPLLVDLARVVLLGRSVGVWGVTAWILASAAVVGGGAMFFNTTRRPFTRWLLRVACSVGVSAKDADVVVAGVAGLTGAAGCLLTYTASTAIQQLLVGCGWSAFLLSLVATAMSVAFHEYRITQRNTLKQALTVYYDAEKNADGLNALMGRSSGVTRAAVAFAVTTPQWIRYQDTELVTWLNVFLARTWPFYNRALCQTIRNTVEPLLEEHRPSILSKICFDALDLGTEPVTIKYVKFVGSRSEAMGVSLEFDLAWAGRSKIMLNATTAIGNTLAIGVKDVEVYAKVQVTLQPLMPALCPFGGLVVTLAEKPLFEFDLELPLGMEGTVSNSLQDWLEDFLSDTLGDKLMWPERLVVPLAKDEDIITLPSGERVTHKWYVDNVLRLHNTGILRVTAKSANDVPPSDLLSKSDAYMRMHIKGATKTKTEVIMNDNDPVWNESIYLLVDDITARHLSIQIMDSDEGELGSDDIIGVTTVQLADLVANETKDMLLEFPETTKQNAKRRKPPMTAHIDMTYFPFDGQGSELGSATMAGIGMLTCRLIRGTGLKSADYNGFSDPFCKVSMDKAWISTDEKRKKKVDVIRFKSKVIKKTLDPEWNETYEFVGVRKSSVLRVECYDRDVGYVTNSKDALGDFELDIAEELPGLGLCEVEREFMLQGDKTITGTITLKLAWQPFSSFD
mmetsp:Transcript_44982/g.72229  ORF Transcript_44982/g.72229 Transcript_44982/m.72229 type:complete len:899 (+) Transcript_44982:330-3026(+)